MKTIKKFLVSILLVLFISTPIIVPVQQAHAQGDWASNIMNAIVNTLGLAKDTAQTAQTLKEGFWEEILNVVAITLSRKASEMMSQKIANWIASGARGPLFQEGEVKDLFKNLGREVLQQGLSSMLNFTNTEFNALGAGLEPVNEGIAKDNLPAWLVDHVRKTKTFNVASSILPNITTNNRTYFEDVVTGVGIKEKTIFFDRNLIDPTLLIQNLESESMNQNRWSDDVLRTPTPQPAEGKINPPTKADDVLWEVTVGFLDCTQYTYLINGLGEPVDFANTQNVNRRNQAGVINYTFQPKAGRYQCEQNNLPGIANLALGIVRSNNTTFADTLNDTFAQATGVDIADVINDYEAYTDNLRATATQIGSITLTGKDPYAAIDLLARKDVNPLSKQLDVLRSLEQTISKNIEGQRTELLAPGTLPEKQCLESKNIAFADGTSSTEVCTRAKISNPSAVVQSLAKSSLESAFNMNENTATWQQALATAAINLTMGIIDGGVRAISRDIQESGSVSASIKGLGIFDWLDPNRSEESLSETINPNAWQSITDREVDFSKLIENINYTVDEADTLREIANVYRPYPAKAFILDRECVLGPDLGYETRIRSLVQPRMSDLQSKSQTVNDDKKKEAYSNFLEILTKKMNEQIQFVQQALSSNPWPGQDSFQNAVRKVREDTRVLNEVNNRASEKRTVANQLISIRNAIISTKSSETLIDLTPLLVPPPKWPEPGQVSIPTIAPSSSFSISNNNLIINRQRVGDQRTQSEFLPTDFDGDGIPDKELTRDFQTEELDLDGDGATDLFATDEEPDSDADGLPDYLEIAICEAYGLCDTDNYYVTEDPNDSFNVSLESDWDMDGTLDIIEFINKTHPKYLGYESVELAECVREAGDLTEGALDCPAQLQLNPRLFYLNDLQAYNDEYTNFLNEIKSTTNPRVAGTRRLLSRLVSQYINIEGQISNQTSLQKTKGDLEQAKQKNADIEELIDQCYQIFFEIDRGQQIERVNIPRINYQVTGFGSVTQIPDFYCSDSGNLNTPLNTNVPLPDPPEICDPDLLSTCQAYAALGQEPPAGICDCYSPPAPVAIPPVRQGEFCFGKRSITNGVPTPQLPVDMFKYRRGNQRGETVKFLRFAGASEFGFLDGFPMYHRNPSVSFTEINPIRTSSNGAILGPNPFYEKEIKPFKDIFLDGKRYHTNGDSATKIQRFDEWKAPFEYPIEINEGEEYSIEANGSSNPIVGSTSATMYALDDLYAMDRAELLYCQIASPLYLDVRDYNKISFERKDGGLFEGNLFGFGGSLIFGPIGLLVGETSKNYSYWFTKNGELQNVDGLDNNWDEIKCQDWYTGSVNDYIINSDQ